MQQRSTENFKIGYDKAETAGLRIATYADINKYK